MCNWVTKRVCDGACNAWNHVPSRVVEAVSLAGDCALRFGQEVWEQRTCLRTLADCATVAGCYIGHAVEGVLQCSGHLGPSEQCLEEHGFN